MWIKGCEDLNFICKWRKKILNLDLIEEIIWYRFWSEHKFRNTSWEIWLKMFVRVYYNNQFTCCHICRFTPFFSVYWFSITHGIVNNQFAPTLLWKIYILQNFKAFLRETAVSKIYYLIFGYVVWGVCG